MSHPTLVPDPPVRERRFRIGCIGAGMIMAECHLAAYQQAGFTVAAIASRTRSKAAAVAERYGIPRVHEDPLALIADPKIEIVDIAYPPDLQPALIRAALAAPHVRGNPKARQEWAVQQVLAGAKASRNLGLDVHVTFSGALAWPYIYPWPPRPAGLIDTAFDELAKRWRPILDAHEEVGVDLAYEIHPGEDLFDGATFEMFLARVDNHQRCNINYDPSHFCLQGLDYLAFIEHYHERIKAFHVKDAELNPTGKQGVYSGFQDWPHRAGRFRSLGDGQVDFGAIFSQLAVHDYDSWAVLEWECAIKNSMDGAREGAEFIARHIIKVSEGSFEDFIGQGADTSVARRSLGLDR